MSGGITTHVLDTATGRPAAGLRFVLERQRGAWEPVSSGETNDDGRGRPLPDNVPLEAGIYRLTFHTGEWLAGQGSKGFYPTVPILFEITAPGEHHHVPLLLSPFGYSTYRGS